MSHEENLQNLIEQKKNQLSQCTDGLQIARLSGYIQGLEQNLKGIEEEKDHKYSKIIEAFLQLMKSIEDEYRIKDEKMKNFGSARQIVLHELEIKTRNGTLTEVESMDLSKLLGDLSVRRRTIKNEYEIYSALLKYSRSSEISRSLKMIENMLNVVKNIETKHKNATYSKTLDDIKKLIG